MGRSIWTEINELRDLTERIVAGEFPTRSPLGPGQIQSKNIRARAITAPLINVSNLEAVNTQTGNLTVDGTITVSTAGKIVSGTNTDDWATFTTSPGGGQGYFHTYDATYGALVAFGDFNNVSGQYVKWDGTALTIKGVIVASSGSIAGWSITTDAIESPDGSVGMASSGHSSIAFWAGSVVPASAEFYVTTAGDLVATSVDIRGDIWAETGRLDNLDIRGQLTLGPSGVIATSGTTGWNSGSGLYYDYNGGAPRFSLGNTSASAGLAWSTGSGLEVKGTITATSGSFSGDVVITGGNAGFRAGQTAYDTGTGFWLGNVGGSPRFSVGNSAGNKLTWNGSTLAITGTLTSTAGSIGGWTIDSSGLRLGSGSTTRGMDTGSTAFYAGSATPGSAPFRVSTAGALVATNATITGAITATSGTFAGSLSGATGTFAGSLSAATGTFSGGVTASSLSITGTASFSGGSMTLPNGGTITSSTLDLNSGTMSGLTVDGTLTMASGGKILLNSAGRIEDADGSYWDQSGITLLSPTSLGDTVDFRYTTSSFRPYSSVRSSGLSTGSQLAITAYYGNGVTYTSQPGASLISNALSSSGEALLAAGAGSTLTQLSVFGSTTSTSSGIDMSVHNRNIMKHRYTDYATSFGGRIYPGPESGSYQTARYINDNGTYMNLQGPINLGNATTGGSNANWSTFTVANIPDKTAAYVVVYVNGTAYRIPLYGNG